MADSGPLLCLIDETSDPVGGDFFVRLCRASDPDPLHPLPMRSALPAHSTVVLVLPFLYCAHRHIEITSDTDTDYLRQNLPFHLEDELVDAVEDVCVFWKVFDTYIEAFVVARSVYDALEKQCSDLGLIVENVLCEQQFYLRRFQDPVLLRFADCLLCIKAGVIIRAHPALASFLLERMELPTEAVVDRQNEQSLDCSMELVSRLGDISGAVSLLSPERKRSNRLRRLFTRLAPVSRAIALAMVLIAAYQGAAAAYFFHASRQVNEQSQVVFQQKFGASKRFSDMEALAKTQLQQGKTIAEYQFLTQFERLAQAWSAAASEDIKLEAVRFHSTKGLTVQVQFKNFEGFERLSQQLKRLGDMELKEMSHQDNITRATLQFL